MTFPPKITPGIYTSVVNSYEKKVCKKNYFMKKFDGTQLAFMSGAVYMLLIGYIYQFVLTDKLLNDYVSLLLICFLVVILSFFMSLFKYMRFMFPKLSTSAEKNTSFLAGVIFIVLILTIAATVKTYDYIYETIHPPVIALISTMATSLFVFSRGQ